MKMPTNAEDCFNPKESLRTCVPWFSREELQHVYSTVFNSDPEVMREGYKYLLVWKARRSFMPPGVEATFYFCEVLLQDGKLQDSSDELFLPQLRLTYSTTIMRFLNLVLDPGPGKTEKKTLFNLADAVGIPRWIVDIRHDSAHGSVLPDIEVLRSAARFSMNWLKERYWEEALKMTDLMIGEGELILSDDERLVKTVLDCWENFSILKLAKLPTKKKVLPQLWCTVNEIAASLKSKNSDAVQNVTDIDGALLILNQKAREILRNRRNHFVKPIFIKRMLAIDSFLPSQDILALFRAKSAKSDFPDALKVAWSDMMDTLWEAGCVPLLLNHLVKIAKDSNESSLRREFAALWMRQILLSLIKVKESRRVLVGVGASTHGRVRDMSEQQRLSAVWEAVAAQRPELRGAYSWDCLRTPLPRTLLTTDLIEKCLTNPQVCNIPDLLPLLLQLLDPPLPQDMQAALKECLSIVGLGGPGSRSKAPKKSLSETLAAPLYTLKDVVPMETDDVLPETSSQSKPESSPSQPSLLPSPWKRSSDIFSWSRAGLGILPWQYDDVNRVWRELQIKNT